MLNKKLETFKTPAVIKEKMYALFSKNTSVNTNFFKLQTNEIFLSALVVVTHDMWRRQRKPFKKVALVTVYFNNISLVFHRVDRKSNR